MDRTLIIFLIILLFSADNLNGQDQETGLYPEEGKKTILYGFMRGGLYGSIDDNDDKPYISSAFSDFGLKAEVRDNIHFKAFADLRFRYGTEFLDPVKRVDLREAYVKVNGKIWDLTAGQTIIKWGRTDFSNPTSKFNPRNFVMRSPDPEDMDIGNLLIDAKIYPIPALSLEAVAVPYYRSSVLLIDPIPLPAYVSINQINSLLTAKEMLTWGLKAQMHLTGLDMSLSWFDGYDPMPGIALTNFYLDMSSPVPVISIEMGMTPYKIRNLGFDFETTAGSIGLRGEAAWSFPYKSFKTEEYVPLSEINYVAGIDWMPGDWQLTAEYSGKTIPDFEAPEVDPIIGTEIDLAALAAMMGQPGFDINEYVRQQVGAFNRLYNYQIEKTYHSAGLRIERDLLYGKLTPSLFTLYNFTSHDFLLMPELRYKPADGLTISAGGDFYSGRQGSVNDLIDGFMNCVKFSLRVDF
jgi:hypothetical protein